MKQLLSLVVVALLAGCASPKPGSPEAVARSPQGKLVNDATRCCIELMCQGKLPGMADGEHGHLETEGIPCDAPISYPASVSIRVTKKDESDYSYTFTKDTATSTWRLAKATRVDKDGHVLGQLFPK